MKKATKEDWIMILNILSEEHDRMTNDPEIASLLSKFQLLILIQAASIQLIKVCEEESI